MRGLATATAAAIIVLSDLARPTLAWTVPPRPAVRSNGPPNRLIQLGRKGSSSLQLSLDDNWDQVAERLIANARIDWNQLSTTTINDLRWNTLFSKEWFAAMERGMVHLVALFREWPLWLQAELVVVPLLLGLVATLYQWSMPPEDYRSAMEPYPRGLYNPVAAQAYYARHPRLVAQRILQLLRLSNRFLLGLAVDKYITRNEEANRALRAEQLLQLITQLGPTAIKVGQALSVRPDLIPAEYAATLSTLQDQVPPFSTAQAKQLLRQELGEERYNLLGLNGKNIAPVASASIGQVYKGVIGNVDVAIKVQRPNVLAEIALDLYIVREYAAPLYQKLSRGATNLQALANEWGRGFIAELDYRQEAAATMRFNDEMAARQLTAVCAPQVLPDYSTQQVLVTQWVDGTRLDQSDADDVPRLCAVALNAYLIMLLELQSLHCDPHPVRAPPRALLRHWDLFPPGRTLTWSRHCSNRAICFALEMDVCAFLILA
jgi:ABC1 atypical kinase-like domain